jgi:hypothetical protein
MPVQYPSHLYIRIDRPLRADLLSAAEAAGQSVSAFARGVLRGSITQRGDVAPLAKVEGVTFRGSIHQSTEETGR